MGQLESLCVFARTNACCDIVQDVHNHDTSISLFNVLVDGISRETPQTNCRHQHDYSVVEQAQVHVAIVNSSAMAASTGPDKVQCANVHVYLKVPSNLNKHDAVLHADSSICALCI